MESLNFMLSTVPIMIGLILLGVVVIPIIINTLKTNKKIKMNFPKILMNIIPLAIVIIVGTTIIGEVRNVMEDSVNVTYKPMNTQIENLPPIDYVPPILNNQPIINEPSDNIQNYIEDIKFNYSDFDSLNNLGDI